MSGARCRQTTQHTQLAVKKHISEHKICCIQLKHSRSESPSTVFQILKQTTEKRIAAFRVWTGLKPAAAWLPSKPLTSHSSRTGISFRQLALRVAPLTHRSGEFFPLANGTSFSFPERGGWKREKWCPAGVEIGFASQDSKDCSDGLSPPVGGKCHEMASR